MSRSVFDRRRPSSCSLKVTPPETHRALSAVCPRIFSFRFGPLGTASYISAPRNFAIDRTVAISSMLKTRRRRSKQLKRTLRASFPDAPRLPHIYASTLHRNTTAKNSNLFSKLFPSDRAGSSLSIHLLQGNSLFVKTRENSRACVATNISVLSIMITKYRSGHSAEFFKCFPSSTYYL